MSRLIKMGGVLLSIIVNSAFALTYQSPIIVDDAYVQQYGNIITGNYQATSTQSAISVTATVPVTIKECNILSSATMQGININSATVTISDCTLQGPSSLITANSSDLTVRNTYGYGTNPNVLNKHKGSFITVGHMKKLDVESCLIEGLYYGVYANIYNGDYSSQQTITILNNQFSNIDGRLSDGNGGYLTTISGAPHAILLNHIYSVPYIEIAWNEFINQPYISYTSDIISIYKSSGTTSSHIKIHDNFIHGAYPPVPGQTYGGGGIVTDGSPSDTTDNTTAFVDIYNNQVVSSANYGIAITVGHDNSVYNNRVVCSGYLPDNTLITTPFANAIENYNDRHQPSNVFYNNCVYNNDSSGLIRPNGSGGIMRADIYLPGQDASCPAQSTNLRWQPTNTSAPTITDENNEYLIWYNKLAANNLLPLYFNRTRERKIFNLKGSL